MFQLGVRWLLKGYHSSSQLVDFVISSFCTALEGFSFDSKGSAVFPGWRPKSQKDVQQCFSRLFYICVIILFHELDILSRVVIRSFVLILLKDWCTTIWGVWHALMQPGESLPLQKTICSPQKGGMIPSPRAWLRTVTPRNWWHRNPWNVLTSAFFSE